MESQLVLRATLVLLLAIVRISDVSAAYDVYWNVPTELCVRFNITFDYIGTDYGITINDGGKFRGNKINILYTPGLFPEIKGWKYEPTLKVPDLSGLEIINGGLPQDGDIMAHLDALDVALNQTVPDTKSNGLLIIDMEHFGATWGQNFGDMEIYRIMSRKRIQDKNPTYTTAKVESEAKLEYERAATNFMVKSLQYVKAIRPYASIGYYQYPQCFNGVGVDSCNNATMEENNQMILHWKRSDAVYPSMYLPKDGTAEEKAMRSRGKVREAKRVFQYAGKPEGLIYPYISYKYYHNDAYINNEDLENLIKVPKEEGANGIVIWGSSTDVSSLDKCKSFNDFVRNAVGPISKKYISK